MNSCLKYFSACLLALLTQAALGQSTAPPLSDGLQKFAVLTGGSAGVTCTDSLVIGDVGSGFAAATPTRCTFAGGIPPATNADAVLALIDFHSAYTALAGVSCDSAHTLLSTITGPVTLLPGTYCTGAALTGAGVLTLDAQNDPNAVWIFKIGAALTGTNFTVTMANGGQACNVYWVPGAGATMTTSAFKGNILAGGATGSITLTGGSLAGRALANVAVSMTNALVGCGVPAALTDALSCPVKKHHKHHHKGNKGGHDHDDDDDDGDHHHGHDNDDNDYGHGKSPWGDKKGK